MSSDRSRASGALGSHLTPSSRATTCSAMSVNVARTVRFCRLACAAARAHLPRRVSGLVVLRRRRLLAAQVIRDPGQHRSEHQSEGASNVVARRDFAYAECCRQCRGHGAQLPPPRGPFASHRSGSSRARLQPVTVVRRAHSSAAARAIVPMSGRPNSSSLKCPRKRTAVRAERCRGRRCRCKRRCLLRGCSHPTQARPGSRRA